MKWILRFKYFTANIVKLIHIVIHPNQDIHMQFFLIGKGTTWPQLCQVSKLSELVLLIYMSLYVLTPIRPGCIFVLY